MNGYELETNEQKLALAEQLRSFQQSDLYRFLVTPIHDEIEGLKHAYDCENLADLATLKGFRKGLDKIFQVMYQIETDAETARAAIKAEQERERRNHPPEDSNDL